MVVAVEHESERKFRLSISERRTGDDMKTALLAAALVAAMALPTYAADPNNPYAKGTIENACHAGNIAACTRWRERECHAGNRAACDYYVARKKKDHSARDSCSSTSAPPRIKATTLESQLIHLIQDKNGTNPRRPDTAPRTIRTGVRPESSSNGSPDR
jgi:hypothetical protein